MIRKSLGTKDLDALLNRLESLFGCRRLNGAKDKLGLELPLGGDIKGLGQTGVDQRVVVLKVGTEAKGFQTGPDYFHGLASVLATNEAEDKKKV